MYRLSKASQAREARIPSSSCCPEDPLLCPVSCLKQYEKATSAFRGKDGQLFLGMVSPHRPVTTSTIARWLKQAIVASGISSEFTAHSTRGAASTAAAMNGVTIREVMARAGWSSQDTFSKHYSEGRGQERKAWGRG